MPLSLAEVLSYSNIGFRFGFKFSFKIFSTRMEKSTMSTSSNNNSPQFPNSKASMLGMVGGGQLGRMFVHEAQALGFKVTVLEPEAGSPAAHAADVHIQTAYDDAAGLQQLAGSCASFTTEFENVPAASLAKLAETGFVAPSAACVSIAQDRIEEKAFFTRCAPQTGILPAPHAILRTAADLENVSADLFPGILKTARMGYDGAYVGVLVTLSTLLGMVSLPFFVVVF